MRENEVAREGLQLVVLLRWSALIRGEAGMLCSFFKWFSDTQQKISIEGIQDEVSISMKHGV